jgi:hypothetical protein
VGVFFCVRRRRTTGVLWRESKAVLQRIYIAAVRTGGVLRAFCEDTFFSFYVLYDGQFRIATLSDLSFTQGGYEL